jgi:hypothetical protein
MSDDLNKMKCSFFLWHHKYSKGGRELKQLLDDRLREKIQRWLSSPDPSVNHNTACEAHHNGTATWFLEGPIYNKWKATGSLLWTHGNRTVIRSFPTSTADFLWFCSGIWQEHSLVGDTLADLRRCS